MVRCGCGKAIEKMPNWLGTVKVEFVCSNCPDRQLKNIAVMHQEQVKAAARELAAAAAAQSAEAEAMKLEDEGTEELDDEI